MTMYDGVIIGAGHNGLTLAAYLSLAGLKIAVIERNRKLAEERVRRNHFFLAIASICIPISLWDLVIHH